MLTEVNATTNGTRETSCFDSTAAKAGTTTVLFVLFVASLVGNIFIALVVYKTKTLRKPINFFILNMAMSDLLFPIFLFPRIVTGLYVDFWLIDGPFGEAMCKIFSYSIDVSTLVSIQSLVMMAVDRFGAVVFPFRSPFISTKLCRFFILATWIISIAIKSPELFAWKLVESRNGSACELRWKDAFGDLLPFKSYILALSVVFWFTPLVLIAILYVTIVLKIKSQKIPGEQSVNVREQRLKRDRNVLKMSVAVVLVFTLCWMPTAIRMLLSFYSSDKILISSCSFQYFKHIGYFLAQSNCAINPWICFIFSGNYRQGLKNILSCLYRTNRVELPKVELRNYRCSTNL